MADRLRLAGATLALALIAGGVAAQPSAPASAPARRAVPTAPDPALEARMLAITAELRCLVCQNQTLADSHADLASDLREQVREMLRRGQSPDQIRAYMTARYGDFILYRPPWKPTTLLLWLGPALLALLAFAALAAVISRRNRLGDERFEPDPEWEGDEAAVDAPSNRNAA